MAKQLNVNLSFTADTSKAKAQLQDLQNQLKSLTVSSAGELGITGDIKNATRAAAELSVHLQNATNVKTGTTNIANIKNIANPKLIFFIKNLRSMWAKVLRNSANGWNSDFIKLHFLSTCLQVSSTTDTPAQHHIHPCP